VPALSPTVVTVTYEAADNSFIVVIGVVAGKLYLPDVQDAVPGKLTFSGPPGQYAVVGQEAGKRIQKTILVAGESPDPDPNPNPTPPPPGPRAAVIIYESERATPQMRAAARGLQNYCKEHGHRYLLVDDDAVDPLGLQPAWLKAYIAKAKEAGIREPYLVVTARSGEDVTFLGVAKFPATGAEAITILKKYGG